MNIDRDTAAILFAFAAFVFGGYSLVKGSIAFQFGEADNGDDRSVSGSKARFISVIIIAAGVALLVNATVGFCMLVAALLISSLLAR